MKIFFLSKDTVTLYLAIFLLMLGVFAFGSNLFASAVTSATAKDVPIYCVETADKKIAFSFDAAWGNEDVRQLIDIFNKYKIKTTIFAVGGWVEKYPQDVKALHDAGHEIVNHSDSHLRMNSLSAEQIKQEISNCDAKIQKVTGATVKLFRPPYGEYNNTVLKAARELGHIAVQWDVDSLDWKDLSVQEITDRVVGRVKCGSICLFHVGTKNTAAALPGIIEALQKQGYSIVKVSELVYKDGYTIDNSGVQKPSKAESRVVE